MMMILLLLRQRGENVRPFGAVVVELEYGILLWVGEEDVLVDSIQSQLLWVE